MLYYLPITGGSKTVTEHAHTWFWLVQLRMLISAFRFAESSSLCKPPLYLSRPFAIIDGIITTRV